MASLWLAVIVLSVLIQVISGEELPEANDFENEILKELEYGESAPASPQQYYPEGISDVKSRVGGGKEEDDRITINVGNDDPDTDTVLIRWPVYKPPSKLISHALSFSQAAAAENEIDSESVFKDVLTTTTTSTTPMPTTTTEKVVVQVTQTSPKIEAGPPNTPSKLQMEDIQEHTNNNENLIKSVSNVNVQQSVPAVNVEKMDSAAQVLFQKIGDINSGSGSNIQIPQREDIIETPIKDAPSQDVRSMEATHLSVPIIETRPVQILPALITTSNLPRSAIQGIAPGKPETPRNLMAAKSETPQNLMAAKFETPQNLMAAKSETPQNLMAPKVETSPNLIPAKPEMLQNFMPSKPMAKYAERIPQSPSQFIVRTGLNSNSESNKKSGISELNSNSALPAKQRLSADAPIPNRRQYEINRIAMLRNSAIGQNYMQRLRRLPFKARPASAILNSKPSLVATKTEAQNEIIYTNKPAGIKRTINGVNAHLTNPSSSHSYLSNATPHRQRAVPSQINKEMTTGKPVFEQTTIQSGKLQTAAVKLVIPTVDGKPASLCPRGMFYHKRNQKCYPLTRRIKAFLARQSRLNKKAH